MRPLAERVATVVLVMLENRSFDHMLGHLTFQNLVAGVDGLETDLAKYENTYTGGGYRPFPMQTQMLSSDLPHEWNQVATQLAYSAVTQQFDMTGFVEAYAAFTGTQPLQQAEPMGFFTSDQVPITSFLAQRFCTCDRWHSPLPTSTQPNRTMAFCGASQIFDTPPTARLIPCEDILFDWLERAGIRWRVYHDGLSFFALYQRAWEHVLGEHFRDFEYYHYDMQVEPLASGPQVIIVEPSYNDAPHIGPDHPNDNHPPLAVGWGEDFLRRVYQAATASPERWAKTVLVYYYDEHGGFYDHVPPPEIGYQTRGSPSHVFNSLGPRIPAIVVSPLVEAGSVCKTLFDHTSVLQLLAELFTPGQSYSAEVDLRRQQGIGSLSLALGDTPRADIPEVPAGEIPVSSALGSGLVRQPQNGLQASFELAASQLMVARPDAAAKKYPELFHWKHAIDAWRRKVAVPPS
jgi:phospholipase C